MENKKNLNQEAVKVPYDTVNKKESLRLRWVNFLIKHPTFAKRWFWATCWRPMTKYEYRWLFERLTIVGNAAAYDIAEDRKHINAIKKYLRKHDKNFKDIKENEKKNNKENINRGMYE